MWRSFSLLITLNKLKLHLVIILNKQLMYLILIVPSTVKLVEYFHNLIGKKRSVKFDHEQILRSPILYSLWSFSYTSHDSWAPKRRFCLFFTVHLCLFKFLYPLLSERKIFFTWISSLICWGLRLWSCEAINRNKDSQQILAHAINKHHFGGTT